MKNGKSKVFKASLVYILVSLLNKGLGIITIPLFTRILSTSEMGIVTTWISWLTMFTPIATMSLITSSFYIAMNQYPDKRDQYQSSILILSTISSISCLIIYLLFHKLLNPIFTLSTPLMIFMFVYLAFAPALDMWLLRQRYEYQMKKMAIVTLISSILSSLVALFLVIIYKNSGYNLGNLRIYGTYIITGLFGVFLYIKIIMRGKTFFNKEFWRFGLMISIPLIFHTLAKNILDVSDKSMISIYCGKDKVGIYGIVYSISTLSLIAWTAINNAFIPYLYEKLKEDTNENQIEICKTSYVMIAIFAVVCIGLTAIAPEIVKLLTTPQYYEAIYIIPPVAAGIFLTCVYSMFANVILFHKKSVGVMIPTIIAAVVNVTLNFIFIPLFGYIAAAYTTLIAYIILSIFQGIVMAKIHNKKLYDMRLMFLSSFIVVGVCLLFVFIYQFTMIRYILIIVVCFIVLIASFIYSNQIMNKMRRILK